MKSNENFLKYIFSDFSYLRNKRSANRFYVELFDERFLFNFQPVNSYELLFFSDSYFQGYYFQRHYLLARHYSKCDVFACICHSAVTAISQKLVRINNI